MLFWYYFSLDLFYYITMSLQKPLSYLPGISAERASVLASDFRLNTFDDLLYFFPYRYVDKSKVYKISQLASVDSEVQIVGVITQVKFVQQKKGARLVATFQDDTGEIELVWFKGAKWIQKSLKIHVPYVLYGKLNNFKGQLSMVHPEMELFTKYKHKTQSPLQPIYHSTEKVQNKGITQKVFRNLTKTLLENSLSSIQESLPLTIINKYKFISKREALLQVHFPKSLQDLAKAQQRMIVIWLMTLTY